MLDLLAKSLSYLLPELPKPSKSLIINWPEEKYTKTGYSYVGLGEATTVLKNVYKLIKPNNIVIVGEHSSAEWSGFMEGALKSGVRGAHQIQKACRK